MNIYSFNINPGLLYAVLFEYKKAEKRRIFKPQIIILSMEFRELLFGIFIVAGLFFLAYFMLTAERITGRIVSDPQESYKIGDKLTGAVIINSDKSLEKETPFLFSLIKNNTVLETDVLNFGEILNKPGSIRQEKSYTIRIGEIIDYTFAEQGVYEIIIYSPDINVGLKKEIDVGQ